MFFSRGLNVTGSTKLVPALNVICLGYNVEKNLELGELKQNYGYVYELKIDLCHKGSTLMR